jgi:hypothetical protein
MKKNQIFDFHLDFLVISGSIFHMKEASGIRFSPAGL